MVGVGAAALGAAQFGTAVGVGKEAGADLGALVLVSAWDLRWRPLFTLDRLTPMPVTPMSTRAIPMPIPIMVTSGGATDGGTCCTAARGNGDGCGYAANSATAGFTNLFENYAGGYQR
jgi:hypothetical protein